MSNTYSLIHGFKLPLLQKIALSGLFIALACILNKVIAINYIPIVPFVRVSFGGPAVIIFSGFLLGPLYGGLIGALQDIVGFLIFDIKSFPYSPAITTTYMLLGFFSGIIFYLFNKIKSIKLSQIIMYVILGVTCLSLSLYLILVDEMTWFGVSHHIDLWMKIVLPILMVLFLVTLILFIELSNKKGKFKDLPINIFQLTLGCFILEVLIMTLYGSFMKSLLFSGQFVVILFFQTMTMFFNIPFNVIVLSFIMKITKKYYFEKRDI